MVTVIFVMFLFDRERIKRLSAVYFTDVFPRLTTGTRRETGEIRKSFAVSAVGVTLLAISAAAYITEQRMEVNQAPKSVAYMIIVSVIIAPFVEEYFFRGVILGYLRDMTENSDIKKRCVKIIINASVSAFVFAMLHSQVALLYSFTGGFLIAVFVQTTNSLRLGLIIHYANNIYALLKIILPAGVPVYLTIIAIITAVAAIITLTKKTTET
jgi:CAAX amino terminal protease family.